MSSGRRRKRLIDDDDDDDATADDDRRQAMADDGDDEDEDDDEQMSPVFTRTKQPSPPTKRRAKPAPIANGGSIERKLDSDGDTTTDDEGSKADARPTTRPRTPAKKQASALQPPSAKKAPSGFCFRD